MIGCKNLRLLQSALTSDPMQLWEVQVPDLRILDLSNTGIVDTCINTLMRSCHHLETLFLNDCLQLRAPQIISNSLRIFSMRQNTRLLQTTKISCPNLREIDLSKTNLKDVTINGAGQFYVPSVEVMMLRYCSELVRPIFSNTISESEGRPNNHRSDGSAAATTTAAQSYLNDHYPNLHTLDLSMCYGLCNSSLHRLVEMSPNLTFLNMQLCKEVQPTWSSRDLIMHDNSEVNSFEDVQRHDILPSHLTRLHELSLRGCIINDRNLDELFSTASVDSLISLNLRNCADVTGGLIRSNVLVEVDLWATVVNDRSLSDLLHQCPNLRRLLIGQCKKLIAPDMRHQRLEELELSQCPNVRRMTVEGEALRQIDASLNFSLTHLDLSQCPQLAAINVQHSSLANIIQPTRPAVADIVIESSSSSIRPQDLEAAPRPSYAFISSGWRFADHPSSLGMASSAHHRASPQQHNNRLMRRGSREESSVSTSASSSSYRPTGESSSFNSPPKNPLDPSCRSPARKPTTAAPKQVSPLARPNSLASAPNLSTLLSSSSSSSAESALISTLSHSSTHSSSHHRGIRSIDLCVIEDRIKSLESKLNNENDKLQHMMASNASSNHSPLTNKSIQTETSSLPTTSSSLSSSSLSSSSSSVTLSDLRATVYGLKKQLAIQRAKLKKEQRELTASLANKNYEDGEE